MNNSLSIVTTVLAFAVTCLAASLALADVALSSKIDQSLKKLHPQSFVMSASVDEDGIYKVNVNAKEEHFLVELTRSGRVLSNVSQGFVRGTGGKAVVLTAKAQAVIRKQYPTGKVVNVSTDDDGLFLVRIETKRGVSTVEVTRSGRILTNDRDATDPEEDFSIVGVSRARHIESVRQLPAAVLAAVEKTYPHGVIVHVYQDNFGPRYGRSAYYASVVNQDQVFSVGLSADGNVLKNEIDNQTQRLERLPKVVRAAAQRALLNGVIYGAGTRDGIHQVDVLVDGIPYDLKISPTGDVLSKKRDNHK